MELKKRCDFKTIFVGLYVLAFVVYIIFGLQPAKAVDYEISARLDIPSIDLIADVTALDLMNGKLKTPDTIVGSYSNYENKTLLIGHSSTVFQDLNRVKLGDIIKYNGKDYKIVEKKTLVKPLIDMSEILEAENNDTLVLMTCAGQMLENSDATHRLIIDAVSE